MTTVRQSTVQQVTVQRVTVQQIVYTEEPQRWWAFAEALGFAVPYPPSPEWGEFHGDGVLAVHRAHEGREVDLHLLVDDLDAAASALSAFDVERGEMAGVGEILTVRGGGVALTVGAGAVAATPGIRVQPIWFAHDLAEPRAILEALGLRAGLASDAGGWIEMHAGGGSVGLHRIDKAEDPEAPPRIGLSFEAPGIDALAERLGDAGFDASIVDEAWARTLRVADPDVWINETQHDLHGYHWEA